MLKHGEIYLIYVKKYQIIKFVSLFIIKDYGGEGLYWHQHDQNKYFKITAGPVGQIFDWDFSRCSLQKQLFNLAKKRLSNMVKTHAQASAFR